MPGKQANAAGDASYRCASTLYPANGYPTAGLHLGISFSDLALACSDCDARRCLCLAAAHTNARATHGYTNADSRAADCYTHGNSEPNPNCNTYRKPNPDCNTRRHPNPACNTYTDAYPHA